jgi:hypothetical protein
MEVPVGTYKADILANDLSTGSTVIIENQLERTNHEHLGKILIYASGLEASIVVWIAKEITEEHRRAIDFLNEKPAPGLNVFGVEIQLWQIDDSRPAPRFEVVAMPNEFLADVRRQQQGLSATNATYLQFWERFKEYCTAEGTTLRLPKPLPQHWYSLAVGRSGFMLSLTATRQHSRVGCEIYIEGINANQYFQALAEEKHQIENQLGELEWQELPTKQATRIVRYRHGVDVTDRETWPDVQGWLKAEAERFQDVFSPRIRAMPTVPIVDEDYEGSVDS